MFYFYFSLLFLFLLEFHFLKDDMLRKHHSAYNLQARISAALQTFLL